MKILLWLVFLLSAAAGFRGAGACETVLTAAEIAAASARAVEFFGPSDGAVWWLGHVVSSAGDVNADGFDDFFVASPQQHNNPGFVYVVFGRSAEAWASATFDFNMTETPDTESWIRISGTGTITLGLNAIAHGDYNGDGNVDMLFGSFFSGVAFCVYGHSGNWSSFSIAGIESGDVPGFKLVGTSATSMFVGTAGDLNGDGIEDLLVSQYESFSYVVFGKAGATREEFNLTSVDGTSGFSLTDSTATLGYGGAMGPLGDVNGDGLADLGIGSYGANSNAGRAYILFARNASSPQWSDSFDLSSELDGSNGFLVEGPSGSYLGRSVVDAGDVNADGFADIFIGSSETSGGAWLVFGHSAPWASSLTASLLSGTDGFHFASSAEFWGFNGGGAGDVNGDGFDDLVIGGNQAFSSESIQTGAAAIIFGRDGPWPSELTRGELVGSVGFQIDGPSVGSEFGYSARGAGDVNGDGIADFIVGAPYYNSGVGYAVLVFGADDHCAVCSNTTDACLICDDGFILNETICEENLVPSSPSPSLYLQSSSGDGSSSSSPSSSSFHLPPFSSSSSSSKLLFSSEQAASHVKGVSVVVIIHFLDDVDMTDPTELEEEIASALGIGAGLVSVVAISPTEVEVTIIGGEEIAQRLVDIVDFCKQDA